MCSKLGGQALVLDVEGTWRELTGVVNKLAANLTNQVRSIAKVTKAVALGDLSKQIEVDARGEILELKNTVNGMVVRLRALAAEVTRVTMEVGSKGQLGGQAHVPDVEGVWLELTRNVSVPLPACLQGGARLVSSGALILMMLITPGIRFLFTRCSLIPGQSNVFELDGPGAIDREGDDGGRARRLDAEDRHRGRGRPLRVRLLVPRLSA